MMWRKGLNDSFYVDTGMEFPETLDYISEITEKWNIRNLHILHPKVSIWNIPPSPRKYFLPCTYWLKIEPFIRFIKRSSIIIKSVFLGDRGDEHSERMKLLTKTLIHKNFAISSIVSIYPLGYWRDSDVQQFIQRHNIPINAIYSKGYDRVGCIFCPYQNFENLEKYNPALLKYLLLKTNSKDLVDLKNNLSKIFIKEKI